MLFALVLGYNYSTEPETGVLPSPLPSLDKVRFKDSAKHIPVAIRNGSIFVKARFNNQMIEGMLDTGCNELVWPDHLLIKGRQTKFSTTINDTNNVYQLARETVIGNITIGGYTVENFPTYEIIETGVHQDGTAQQNLIIGNSFFLNSALTIDYHKSTILVRPSGVRIEDSNSNSTQYKTRFEWLPDARSQRVGVPAIRGRVNGKSALIEIDTGWNEKNVAVSNHLWDTIPVFKSSSTKIVKLKAALSTVGVQHVSKAKIQIPVHVGRNEVFVTIITPAVKSNSATKGADAVIGSAFLENFRVTIDYPRQEIFLEPN